MLEPQRLKLVPNICGKSMLDISKNIAGLSKDECSVHRAGGPKPAFSRQYFDNILTTYA